MRISMEVFATILFLGLATTAMAAPVWHTEKIERIYPYSDGSFVLIMANDSSACTSTASPKYYHVQIGQNGVTELGLKNMLSVAMFAAAAELNVSINFDDSTNQCYINRLQARIP